MEKEKAGEVLIWTKEEYQQFSNAIKDRSVSFIAFEILYWCGLRLGELLALTPSDFEHKIVSITKSYQRNRKWRQNLIIWRLYSNYVEK